MEDSTSIADLPNPSGAGGAGGAPVQQVAQFPPQQAPPQQQAPMPPPQAPGGASSQTVIDPKYMNYIITGIQQTGGSTLGTLPSRDIPMNTLEIQQDEYIRANYVPPPAAAKHVGFVEDYENRAAAAAATQRDQKKKVSAAAVPVKRDLIEELYIPILVAILYFIFQMSAFSHFLFKYAKFLHNADGNPTQIGLFCKTALFGAGVYAINHIVSVDF